MAAIDGSAEVDAPSPPPVTEQTETVVKTSLPTSRVEQLPSTEPASSVPPPPLSVETGEPWRAEESDTSCALGGNEAPEPVYPEPGVEPPHALLVPSVAPVAFSPEPSFPQPKRRLAQSASLVLLAGAAVAATLLLQQARGPVLTVSASGVAGQSLRTASVTVDGELKCSGLPCDISGVRSGDHLIRVVTTEYGAVERIITLGRGQHHSADFFLERPSRTAAMPSSRPPEPPPPEQPAKPQPEQPKEPAPQGISQLADLKTVSQAAAARPGKARVTTATTKINSIPVSQVTLDGRVVGNTPLTMAVNAGSHAVVFDHSEFGRREVVVEVKPDQEAVASVLLRPRDGS